MCQVNESTTEMTLHMCCPFRYDVCLLSSYAFMQCVMNRAGIKRKSEKERDIFGQEFRGCIFNVNLKHFL
jgi:hypothetical protein